MENDNNDDMTQDISGADIRVQLLSAEMLDDLSHHRDGEWYGVTVDGNLLVTPQGSLIRHSDARAIRELAAELEYTDELDVRNISLFNLLCTQIDFAENNLPEFTRDNIDACLLNDPVLRTCAGPEIIDQLKYLYVIEDYLKEHNIVHPHMPQVPLEDHSWFSEKKEANFSLIVDLVFEEQLSFDAYMKTVFVTVIHVFDSPLLGLLLAMQRISAHEFAVVYMTVLCINSKVFSDGDRDAEKQGLDSITKDVECMERYLKQFKPSPSEVELLVQQGESTVLEFKSTLRWNIHAGKKDPKIEHAVLKTVAGFLNADGGNLLVGIDDKGEPVGIELDQFPNEDKYLLHFTNLINDKIGKQHTNKMRWDILPFKGKKILKVECLRSPQAVFVKTGNDEKFYVRTGPSTAELSGSQILEYSKEHFNT